MKILLRYWDEKYYVWKDATYKNGRFYIQEPGWGEMNVETVNILSIKDDNRKDSVVCANCGEIIANNPESIEKHFADIEAKRNCFKCGSLSRNSHSIVNEAYTKNDDGTYNFTSTVNVSLKCRQQWYNSPSIDSDAAKKICIYHRCRRSGVTAIEDMFTKYPDLFKKQLAVDVLIEKKFTCEGHNYGYFEYDLKCRNTIKACVNELGIVDHFIVKCRSGRHYVYYSAVYELLLFNDGYGKYTTDIPYGMTENKLNQLKTKISALYKEEESK